VEKAGTTFTAGSYAGPAVRENVYHLQWTTQKGPLGRKPAVIITTAACLKTVGESPGGD